MHVKASPQVLLSSAVFLYVFKMQPWNLYHSTMCTESLYMCICAQQGKQGVMGGGKALVSVSGGAAVEQITAVRRAQASWDRIKRLQRAQTQITRDVHQRHNPAVPLVSVSGRTQSLTGRLARKKCTHLWYVHGKTFEMKSRSKHAKKYEKTWQDLCP